MSEERINEQLERRLTRALHAAAPRPDPGLADRLLSRIAVEPQRRRWSGLSLVTGFAAAAAVVMLAVVVGLQVGRLLPNVEPPPVGQSPSAAPSVPGTPEPSVAPPSVSPSTSATPSPAGQTCTNEELGFTVAFPADWWANEEISSDDPVMTPIAACTYFSEEPVEIQQNSQVPPTVAISAGLVDRPIGEAEPEYRVISSETATVAGRPATVEEVEWTADTVFIPAGTRRYAYEIQLVSGEVLSFTTSAAAPIGDAYAEHKRVLDAMMDSLELSAD